MRILLICNWHRFPGGRETVAENTKNLLIKRKHEAQLLVRDSRKYLSRGTIKKIVAFSRGFYSSTDRKFISNIIAKRSPEIVHIHGLFPFFSPWIMVESRRAGVPVILTCHDDNLSCPIGHHFRNGQVCELCLNGKEYWCAIKNCRGNYAESFAYALRSAFIRKIDLFKRNVDCFIAISKFTKRRLIEMGISPKNISIVHNMVKLENSVSDPSLGTYAVYIGRISPEKGIETLLAAARKTNIPVRIAGDYSLMPEIVGSAPSNVHFTGHLNYNQLRELYCKARFLVLPSLWNEIFPLVILEAMSYGLPVIASTMGGITEVVENGVTGFLFNGGSVQDLSNRMSFLWEDPKSCIRMGRAGREKAMREYGEDIYYNRLIKTYEKTIAASMRTFDNI